jgi:hypothetical protein
LKFVFSSVLCVEQTLPADEVKDLNRGRAYLANVADRHNVTVFQSLEVALQEVSGIVVRRRAARVAQFVADDDGGGDSTAEEGGGDSGVEEGDSATDGCLLATAPTDPPPSAGAESRVAERALAFLRGVQQGHQQRPSLTSAIADLATQFAQGEFGADDAISDDDDDSVAAVTSLAVATSASTKNDSSGGAAIAKDTLPQGPGIRETPGISAGV